MDSVVAMLGILGPLLLGVASPGPSFIFVSRTAVARSRRAGLLSALGMGVGGLVFSLLALFGIGAVLHSHERLFHLASLAGGLYLLHLAGMLLVHARQPLLVEEAETPAAVPTSNAFLSGLWVQISNPKTMVVYASVFASMLPADMDWWIFLVLPALIFLMEAGWYGNVAILMSSGALRGRYIRAKVWIDAAAGLVIGGLGGHIIVDALKALL
jgi:threonine/homoserine/homoserine lactone efflux protein